MKELRSRIRELADELYPQVVETRRHLHAHPELSFHEQQTAAFVRERLEAAGIACESGIGGYGVVGTIQGAGEGPVLALRADMDALPISEANDVPYCSRVPGVMHACGHDAHTASLLGTALIINKLKSSFHGTLKLIFQPAEEKAPGGASLMIRDGVLKNPAVDAIIGQHVQPYLPAGKVGIRSGIYMASADELYITVKGKGGHAAHPGDLTDPVMATAQMLVAMQQVVSRSDPRIPSVLSFGTLRAEGATNIIPDEVYVEGTFRTMNEGWREKALEKIERIARQVAGAFGAEAQVNIVRGYPVLYNDEALTRRCRQQIAAYAGEENVIDLDLWMASEDFAFYTHEVPGCFYRIGTRNEARGIIHGLHTPRFDIDESALRLSTGLMAWLAICELNGQEGQRDSM